MIVFSTPMSDQTKMTVVEVEIYLDYTRSLAFLRSVPIALCNSMLNINISSKGLCLSLNY